MTTMTCIRPESLDEAVDFLHDHGPDTHILAGGTDLMVDLRSGENHRPFLLDISRIETLKTVELSDDQARLYIGSGVTLTRINTLPLIKEHAPALHKCSFTFASRQIRNMATIGGNVAHASPCGDTIPPLVIHEAEAVVANRDGNRTIPLLEMTKGAYRSALHPEDLVVALKLKTRQPGFFDFQKIGRRKALATSRMSMAVMADKDDQGRISFIRFSLGACTPTPQRMHTVESLFAGKNPTVELMNQGAGLLAEKMVEITGRRPSISYKEPAVQGLFKRMIYPMITWCRQ
ncbi:MAG: FAD binding domain-containing protein [Desulfotignum sp.]|nr:FAD binding domain-containing protein [Desulfotignum sp.]